MSDRLWFLRVNGFDPFMCVAPTRSKARYMNAKSLNEAWHVPMKQAFQDIKSVRLAKESDLAIADNGHYYEDYFKTGVLRK